MKAHCLFEQSGTFKNEFIKLGVEAEDYDILNDFNQTDHLIDLYGEIEKAHGGATLYDWFNVNQVKNVSKRYNHPCIMPLEVMKKVVGILPKDALIFDPFMGSGTTALACMELGYDFIGTEINEDYYEIAQCRIKDFTTQPELFDEGDYDEL